MTTSPLIEYEDPLASLETMQRTLRDVLNEQMAEEQRQAARRASARKLLSLNVTILQAPSLKPGEIMVDTETYNLLKHLAEYDR